MSPLSKHVFGVRRRVKGHLVKTYAVYANLLTL